MHEGLATSLVALVIGPFVAMAGGRSRALTQAIDAFVVVTIVGLVLAHIFPHSFAAVGPVAVPPAALGLIAPALVHRWLHERGRREAISALGLALLALSVHALMDGVALAGGGHGDTHGNMLTVAVVLHRLPVGIAIWWVARPALGPIAAWSALVVVCVATVLGFWLGEGAMTDASTWGLGIFQALMAGFLLHVVAHHRDAQAGEPSRVAAVAGTLVGTAFLVGVTLAQSEGLDHPETLASLVVILLVGGVYAGMRAREKSHSSSESAG
jgi:hypothetical protein